MEEPEATGSRNSSRDLRRGGMVDWESKDVHPESWIFFGRYGNSGDAIPIVIVLCGWAVGTTTTPSLHWHFFGA